MPRMNREELLRHNGFRDRIETVQNNVQSDSLRGLVTVPYRSIEVNRKLILQAVSQSKRALSRTDICKRIKRKKAPGIVALIEQLVAEGLLVRHQSMRANGVVMYHYTSGRKLDAYGNEIPDWLLPENQ